MTSKRREARNRKRLADRLAIVKAAARKVLLKGTRQVAECWEGCDDRNCPYTH
jgi:hypothetical protein